MDTETPPITTPIADLIRGALELEHTPGGTRPHRLPARARAQTADTQLAMAEAQPAGVRLAFRTAATAIELRASAVRFGHRGLPARPPGVFDLLVDGRLAGQGSLPTATQITIDPATGATSTDPGEPGGVRFDGLAPGDKHVELWLPHNEIVELASLHTDAPVGPAETRRPTWLHHGSSISQGSNAEHPTGTWPAIAASIADVEPINLGFGGSALLDPFTARAIRDTPADRISLKLGINIVGGDLMRARAFEPAVHGFLDTIREGHPDTPLLVVSSLHCRIHEDTPGPGAFDQEALEAGETRFRATGDPAEAAAGKLTLTAVRRTLTRIVAERGRDDPNLHYLDGLELYGPDDEEELPLLDALHPGPAAHRRIATRFASLAFAAGKPLAPTGAERDH